MLRLLIALALVLGTLWFMLRDGGTSKATIREDVEKTELAQTAVSAQEEMAAQMAAQTDAIRDQAAAAQAVTGQGAGEGGEGDEGGQ